MPDLKTALNKAGVESADDLFRRLCREALAESGNNFEQSIAVLDRKICTDARAVSVLRYLLDSPCRAFDDQDEKTLWRAFAKSGLRTAAEAARAAKSAGKDGQESPAEKSADGDLPSPGGRNRASGGQLKGAKKLATSLMPPTRSTKGAEGQPTIAEKSAEAPVPSAPRVQVPAHERQFPYRRINAMAAVGNLIAEAFRLSTMTQLKKQIRDLTQADCFLIGGQTGRVAEGWIKLANTIPPVGTVGDHIDSDDQLQAFFAGASLKELAHHAE